MLIQLYSSYEVLKLAERIREDLQAANIDDADFLDLPDIQRRFTLRDYLEHLCLEEAPSDNGRPRIFCPIQNRPLSPAKIAATPTLQLVVERQQSLDITPITFDPCKPSGQFSTVTMFRGKSDCSFGLRFCIVNGGIYICHVKKDSPAARAGLRFLDQITHIDDEAVTGLNVAAVMKKLENKIYCKIGKKDRFQAMGVQLYRTPDRPVGIHLTDGVICAVEQNSSAADNGVPLHTHIIEVNGVNVVGFSDEKILEHIYALQGPFMITLLNHDTYKALVKR
ncbi:unnamed protein product [Schistocephalus solidus]|uniref:PDZ domain-containing protein n=1 Tax=Schistocephalus solidus TaxID=70667 RepID=A0A183S7L4_SCHSO|nr:unnamed protein product [Schistocephalus solidus]